MQKDNITEKILNIFKGTAMNKCKGIATALVAGLIFLSCVAAAFVAQRYLPKDEADAIEIGLEDVAEDEAEAITHMPAGSLKQGVDSIFPKVKQV